MTLVTGLSRIAVSATRCYAGCGMAEGKSLRDSILLVLALGLLACDGGRHNETFPSSASERNAPVVTSHDALYGGIALDERRVMLVGRFGEIWRSTDGGRRWARAQTVTEHPLFAIDFFDEAHGIAVGENATCLRTRDAGESWSRLDLGLELQEPLFALQVVGTQAAYAVGSFGTILRTDDRGESWKRSEIDWERVLPDISEDLIAYEPTLYTVAEAPGGRIWAAGEYGVIIASNDNGVTWETLREGRSDQPPLFALAFAEEDSGRGVVVGQQGTILRTVDGGSTWEPCDGGVARDLYDVTIFSGGALAVGAADTVVVSDRGLCAWRPVPPSKMLSVIEGGVVFPWLGAVIINPDSSRVIVVGEGGIIRHIGREALNGDAGSAELRPQRESQQS